MDISSDSSDTIILPLTGNDVAEPSDTEIENILRKYSSTSTSGEFVQGTSPQSNLHTTGKSFEELTDFSLHKKVGKNHDKKYSDEFSDEEFTGVPPLKRPKKDDDDDDNIKNLTDEIYDWKSDRNKYGFEDYSSGPDDDIEIVSENKNVSAEYLDMDSEEILSELNNKYLPSTSKDHNQQTDVVVLSDDSDTNELSDRGLSRCPDTFPYNAMGALTGRRKSRNSSNNRNKNNSSEDEPGTELDKPSPKTRAKSKRQRDLEKKKKDRAREKERKQEEAAKKKAMKNMEKERKREEAERQKAMKNALKTVEQSTKPDECIKHMIVELPPEILQKDYGELLKTTLRSCDISFKSTPQALPNLVSWCRKLQTLENMVVKNTEVNEKHFLLIMDKSEFLANIRKNSLKDHIQTISNLIKFRMLTVAVLGLSKVTADQDLAVVETQLLLKCYFRYVQQAEDLATLILEVTKAIAQMPHKAKKEEKYKLHTEYFNDSNKDTVRVDKNGNGLGRLWQQMLTMFPLARLETAEAITAVYPTPDSLFKAYDGCQSKKEELLQDLPIRRALGPCTSVRRIGPELSRKCSNFFCSTDNVLI